ncbi:VanZ family protein [Pseudothauera nasutitermitis]|uniref:VanZ family protein n=1 Tax=Pseudothauera nasutitermitis TaxID=2565930 RepID=A0A4S4AZK0_9RHOO|nr:VanZ family protein [Pseudothauera nasutitermitis]THF64052.1 VanZ family protein [Pseudothauera nasutitermitis]
MARASSNLPLHLAIAYAALIAYACLHPFTGWQAIGLPPFDYLTAPWPRYYRVEDIVLNVLGYVPLGFVLAAGLARRLGPFGRILATVLLAGLLSLALETTQNYLPTRVASNLDLGFNLLGGLIGAFFGSLWGSALFAPQGGLQRWRGRRFIGGHTGDAGLILLALWLLTQFTADGLLFGSGDLRQALDLPNPVAFAPERFILLEAAHVAATLVGVGLFVRCIMLAPSVWPILLLFALALGATTLATFSFFSADEPLAWLTPGARRGLAIGVPLLGISLLLPRVVQHALAGMAILAATALVNLMPENPYLSFRHPAGGHFLNFHGLTGVAAAAWPFLALAYLSALGLWRGEHLADGRRI